MSDFIREVDEDYRRDRLMAFLARYQVLIAVFVVLVIGGAGGYRYWTDRQVTAAQRANDRYAAAVALAKAGKTQEAEAAYAALAADGPPGYAALARLRAAANRAIHDPEGGAAAFDAVAGDETLAVSLRDTARLRGAMIRVDHEDPKAFDQRYGRFAAPGFAYADSMRELLALAALKRQDMTAAGRYLDDIIVDPNAPAAVRGRAQAFRALVVAGPATSSARLAPPAKVTILGQTSGQPAAPAGGQAGEGTAAAAPAAVAPAAAPTPTPPAPSPAAPPAAAAAPTPPATAPVAPVPPSIKPPGNAPPD
jgi:hypothetical protein